MSKCAQLYPSLQPVHLTSMLEHDLNVDHSTSLRRMSISVFYLLCSRNALSSMLCIVSRMMMQHPPLLCSICRLLHDLLHVESIHNTRTQTGRTKCSFCSGYCSIEPAAILRHDLPFAPCPPYTNATAPCFSASKIAAHRFFSSRAPTPHGSQHSPACRWSHMSPVGPTAAITKAGVGRGGTGVGRKSVGYGWTVLKVWRPEGFAVQVRRAGWLGLVLPLCTRA